MPQPPYDYPPAPINDEQLGRLLAGERIEFQVWLACRLVLRRMQIRGRDVKVRDEVLLEVSN
jgi:hypothetical protein